MGGTQPNWVENSKYHRINLIAREGAFFPCVCCKYGIGDITISRPGCSTGTKTTIDCPSAIKRPQMIRTTNRTNPLEGYGMIIREHNTTKSSA